jgi:hypothetical protein
MKASSSGAAHALSLLGDVPGKDAGRVTITFINPPGAETYDTNDCLIVDLGLIISNNEMPYRFIPMGNIAFIDNARE